MASEVSSFQPLGDPNHGGALFILPREIRDKIYRPLLKKDYSIIQRYPGEGEKIRGWDDQTDRPTLVILGVSRIISYEVQELLYAESTFNVTVDFSTYIPLLEKPHLALDRVKKVKIVIRGLTSQSDGSNDGFSPGLYSDHIAGICRPTIEKLMGTLVRRDSCHIHFYDFGPQILFPLTSFILPKFAAFNGFDSILVEVFMEERYERLVRRQHNSHLSRTIAARFQEFGHSVTDTMEPTLGPAISSNDDFTIRLQFKPREHVPSILRAQAHKLLQEADRLEQSS